MKSKLMALADEACSHMHNNKYVTTLQNPLVFTTSLLSHLFLLLDSLGTFPAHGFVT